VHRRRAAAISSCNNFKHRNRSHTNNTTSTSKIKDSSFKEIPFSPSLGEQNAFEMTGT